MSIIFNYHARDANGKPKNGTIEAVDQDDAVNKLQAEGLVVISLKAVENMQNPKVVKKIQETVRSIQKKIKAQREKTETIKIEALSKPSQQKSTKKCPHCAEIVKFEATKCRYCQGNLSVKISEVIHNSLADKMNLQKGDIILSINNRITTSIEAINDIEEKIDSGHPFNVEILRDGELLSSEVVFPNNKKSLGLQLYRDVGKGNVGKGNVGKGNVGEMEKQTVQARSGIMDGVNLGCGMFIVLPLLIIGAAIILFIVFASMGSF